jgi:parallel beta-helix repeat protein
MLFRQLLLLFVLLTINQLISYSSILPCSITSEVILTEEKSPYFLECDLVVENEGSLILMPGSKLFVKPGKKITVKGTFDCRGTKNNIAYIGNEIKDEKWAGLFPDSGELKWEHTTLSGAYIVSKKSKLDLNHVIMQEFDKNQYMVIRIENGSLKIKNSEFYGNGGSQEAIILYNVDNAVINDNLVTNFTDAIEFINCNGGEISGNFIYDCFDDGIDFNNSSNILISNNIITNIRDSGLSIGSEKHGPSNNNTVINNYVSFCKYGIDIASGSDARLHDNTFFNNITAVKLFEKYEGEGGSSADVRNNIFYNSDTLFEIEQGSNAVIEYNLSNTSALDGSTNLFADPIIMDINSNRPIIDLSSPCRNAGDPALGIDSDGSISDIGTGFYNERESIIISEIDYAPFVSKNPSKWIELCNSSPNRVNVSSWVLRSQQSDSEFIFPENTFISRKSCLILASDSDMFKGVYDEVEDVIGGLSIDLDLDINTLTLSNSSDKLIDFVSYSTSASSSWNILSGKDSRTLELLSIDSNNNNPSSWDSESESGSPSWANGMENLNISALIVDLFIYPNPASTKLNIESFGFKFSDIKIYNAKGLLVQQSQSCCNFLKTISISKLPKGFYFIEIQTDVGIIYKKLMK